MCELHFASKVINGGASCPTFSTSARPSNARVPQQRPGHHRTIADLAPLHGMRRQRGCARSPFAAWTAPWAQAAAAAQATHAPPRRTGRRSVGACVAVPARGRSARRRSARGRSARGARRLPRGGREAEAAAGRAHVRLASDKGVALRHSHAQRTTVIRWALPPTERLFWHCGAHTAEPTKIGV